MTRSWQVYIPEQIRKSMGIDAPTLFEATVKDNSLVLKPTKSRFLELGGALNKYHKKNPNIDIDNIRDYIDYSDL